MDFGFLFGFPLKPPTGGAEASGSETLGGISKTISNTEVSLHVEQTAILQTDNRPPRLESTVASGFFSSVSGNPPLPVQRKD